ncbi:hypothetical protein JFY74_17230 [Pectobacterium carotovorum]|nr:hypothetical protein JFY74_17230 [Pectobacterium carotovorum]
MDKLLIKSSLMEKILSTRKMIVSDISTHVQYVGDCIEINNLTSFLAICKLTCISPNEFLSSSIDQNFSKIAPVLISRREHSYERVKGDASKGGYHYRHVLKTSVDPDLLVLRTTPLSTSENVTVNSGHLVRELVYVLNGKVGFIWKNLQGDIRKQEMNEGDSVYIQSFVPHAFYSIILNSEILAVDYL